MHLLNQSDKIIPRDVRNPVLASKTSYKPHQATSPSRYVWANGADPLIMPIAEENINAVDFPWKKQRSFNEQGVRSNAHTLFIGPALFYPISHSRSVSMVEECFCVQNFTFVLSSNYICSHIIDRWYGIGVLLRWFEVIADLFCMCSHITLDRSRFVRTIPLPPPSLRFYDGAILSENIQF